MGYGGHSKTSSKGTKPTLKFNRNFSNLKDFMTFFITENTELVPENTTQSSVNVPFMDYIHIPLIDRVIPKSEEVCSSIQLMSFWKFYSDIIDLTESEVSHHLDSDPIQSGAETICSNKSDEVVTQSLEVEKEVSEEIKAVSRISDDFQPVNDTSPSNQTEVILKPENVSKPKRKLNKGKKKKVKTKRRKPSKRKAIYYGFYKYYDID